MEHVMVIPGNEVLHPEHLSELGALFDQTWASLRRSSDFHGSPEERAELACILLHLYGLRQLGPDQLVETALRLLKQSSDGNSESIGPTSASLTTNSWTR